MAIRAVAVEVMAITVVAAEAALVAAVAALAVVVAAEGGDTSKTTVVAMTSELQVNDCHFFRNNAARENGPYPTHLHS